MTFEYTGSLAVYAFFFLSGILVSASYDRLKSPLAFAIHRFARIWPGLVVAALVALFLIVPLTSGGSYFAFVTSPATFRCLASNLTFLAGLCIEHPLAYPSSFFKNGIGFPMWTVLVEVHCYILVLVLGLCRLLRPGWVFLLTMSCLFATFLLATHYPPSPYRAFWLSIVATLAITCILACASWRLVEKPSLRAGRLLSQKLPNLRKPRSEMAEESVW